jgi:hypothetical protein
MIYIAVCGRALNVRRGDREAWVAAPNPDAPPGEWARAVSQVYRRGLRAVDVVVGLPAEQVVLLRVTEQTDRDQLKGEAARHLRCDPGEVVLAGDGPVVAAVPRGVLAAVQEWTRAAGLRLKRIDLTAAAMLRGAGGGVSLVVCITPEGAEIAGGSGPVITIARTLLRSQDVYTEVQRTIAFMSRVVGMPDRVVLLGHAREPVVQLRDRLASEAGVTAEVRTRAGDPTPALSLSVAGEPSFPFPLPERARLPLLPVASAAAALVIAASGVPLMWESSNLQRELEGLQAQSSRLQAEIRSRKPSPAVLKAVADAASESVDRRLFDVVRDRIPDGVWLDRMSIDRSSIQITGRSVTRGGVFAYVLSLGGTVTRIGFQDVIDPSKFEAVGPAAGAQALYTFEIRVPLGAGKAKQAQKQGVGSP